MSPTEQVVQLGYDKDVLHFRVEAPCFADRHRELTRAIRRVKEYNEFKGPDVADVVDTLVEHAIVTMVAFGREGSPVLYLEPNGPELIPTIKKAFEVSKPDECDVQPDGTVRLWWD